MLVSAIMLAIMTLIGDVHAGSVYTLLHCLRLAINQYKFKVWLVYIQKLVKFCTEGKQLCLLFDNEEANSRAHCDLFC